MTSMPSNDRTSDEYSVAREYFKNFVVEYRKAAYSGDVNAQYRLGRLYEYGIGVRANAVAAARWYRKATRQGLVCAKDQLIAMAKRGDIFAQRSLGHIYENGWGVKKNLSAASKWYRKAAERDDIPAFCHMETMANRGSAITQYYLGEMHEYGTGIRRNFDKAVGWYRMAADGGNAKALCALGDVYATGEGVGQDFLEAFYLFVAAAQKKNADTKGAQYKLGYMCFNGFGVPQSYDNAMSWYMRSASKGNTDAQNNIGIMYDLGLGVKRDKFMAAAWYTRAAAGGNAYAKENLAHPLNDVRLSRHPWIEWLPKIN